MISQELIQQFVEFLVSFATSLLLPAMVVMFGAGVALRTLIFYTVKREDWFSKEFGRRVEKFVKETHKDEHLSFYVTMKRLLEKTFYETLIELSKIDYKKFDPELSLKIDEIIEARNE